MDIYFSTLLLNTRPIFLNDELKLQRRRLQINISYKKHCEKRKQEKRNYTKNNLEKRRECNKKYFIKNPKSQIKSRWKGRGLNMTNFEEVYNRYQKTNHCDLCGILLTTGRYITSTTKCLDHSHITGLFRNVVCQRCNIQLPPHT